MIYAKSIRIEAFQSSIEVFADFGDDEVGGRIYIAHTSADDIPSASYIPTIDEIRDEARFSDTHGITRKKAREIKDAIRRNTQFRR